jgi:hypothetical protein
MDVFKSQDLEMIATTNNFPSSKEKEREKKGYLGNLNSLLLIIYTSRMNQGK